MPKLSEQTGKVKRSADLSFEGKKTRKKTSSLAEYLLRISPGIKKSYTRHPSHLRFEVINTNDKYDEVVCHIKRIKPCERKRPRNQRICQDRETEDRIILIWICGK
jgi:hypothetical protein